MQKNTSMQIPKIVLPVTAFFVTRSSIVQTTLQNPNSLEQGTLIDIFLGLMTIAIGYSIYVYFEHSRESFLERSQVYSQVQSSVSSSAVERSLRSTTSHYNQNLTSPKNNLS
jgi:hypothetical protein